MSRTVNRADPRFPTPAANNPATCHRPTSEVMLVALLSGRSAMTADTVGMTPLSNTRRTGVTATTVAVVGSLFIVLGFVAHHAGAGTSPDHTVLTWMVHHRTPGLTSLAIAVTNVGSPAGVAVLAAVAAAASWWRLGSPRPTILILTTICVAGAISTLSKIAVGAHRPAQAVQLVVETDPSFPSGHVTGTLALLGALAVVIDHHGGRVVSLVAIALTAVGTAAVAVTRLYLGVHWFTDIVGGVLLGCTAAGLACAAYRRMMGPLDIVGRDGARAPSGPVAVVGT